MFNNIQKCNICGSDLVNGACPNCSGNTMQGNQNANMQNSLNGNQVNNEQNSWQNSRGNNNQFHMEPQWQNSDIPFEEPPQKENSGFLKRILPTVAVVIVGFLLIMYFNNKTEKENINKIDEFIAQVEDYKPGVIEDDVFKSEYWDFNFELGHNWQACEDEVVTELTNEIEKTAETDCANALKRESDISDTLKEKLIESIYARAEMAAYYKQYGFVVMKAIGMYGITDEYVDEYVAGVRDELALTADDVTTAKETILGNEYDVVSGTYKDGSRAHHFIREKGGLICFFSVICDGEHETEVLNGFMASISEYK